MVATRKRSTSPTLAARRPAAKRTRTSSAGKSEATSSASKVAVPAKVDISPDAVVKSTGAAAKVPYLERRCKACNGKSVKQCVGLKYKNAAGVVKKYTVSDLRYDIQGSRLKLVGGTKPKKIAPVARGARVAAAKGTAAATSVASGVRLSGSSAVMPVVGFGTYKLDNAVVKGATLKALKHGYRLIDTAQVYENEGGVGAALKASGLPREDVFIETKVWRSSHGYERTLKAANKSLRKLGVDYIDLYVIHWPGCKTGWPLPRGTCCPPDWTPAMRNTGTWRAMEQLYKEGKVKAIGVTNYSVRHLKELLKVCKIKPMVNQVEFHPRLVQTELLSFCKKQGIAVQAYASLGSGDAKQTESFFAFPPVQAAAKAHKRTPAQVLLRWAIEKGCHVVPKSVKEKRLIENAKVFGFKLTPSEVKAIDKLHNGTRYAWKGLDPDTIK